MKTILSEIKKVPFIFTLLSIFAVSLPHINGQNVSKNDIDKYAQSYFNDKHNKALIIGILKNGKQYIYTYGETEKGKGIRPDTNSIFEIGGVSELFTSSLLAILESKGVVSSVEPVSEILKDIVKVPYYQRIICEKPPTNPTLPDEVVQHRYICFPDPTDVPQLMVLCDLATHSAGLPEEPSLNIFNGKNPYVGYTTEKLNKYIASLPPNQAFGYQYNHSMVGTALLAEALSHKAQKDYNSLLKDEILTPLGMSNTFVTPTSEQNKLFITGHTSKGNPINHRDYNAFIPAAGLRSNVPDLLRFMAANLSTEVKNLNVALSDTHIPRIYADPASDKFMVGWGWIIMPVADKDKRNIVWQCSEKGGFASFMGFNKESQTAVVILSNTPNAVDQMGIEILKTYIGNVKKSNKTVYSLSVFSKTISEKTDNE